MPLSVSLPTYASGGRMHCLNPKKRSTMVLIFFFPHDNISTLLDYLTAQLNIKSSLIKSSGGTWPYEAQQPR